MRLRPLLLIRVATKDLQHGWQSTSCLIVAVLVALLPLLLLYGLKYGIVSNLIENLNKDPRVREIRLNGDQELSKEWFEALANDERVGFILPRARYLAASARLGGPNSRRMLDSRIIPTNENDPYLQGKPPPKGLSQAVLTERAAVETGVEVGKSVTMVIGRIYNGEREVRRINLEVVGIVPRNILQTNDIFLSPELEQIVELWREGFAVPELGWPGLREESNLSTASKETYSSFRLFAQDIRYVSYLRNLLLRDGLDIITRSSEIERTLAIESALGWVFLAVTTLSAAGFLLTLGLHLAASVVEKARELSVLRLLGFTTAEISLIPSIQGILIATVGSAVSCTVALMAQPIVNSHFEGLADLEGEVSRLDLTSIGITLVASALAGGIAGSFAGLKAANLEPTEGLRRD